MIWIYYYLLNGIKLDISCWIPNIPKLCYKEHEQLVFHTSNIAWRRKIELAKLDCITNCLTDNSTKFSYYSNSIPAWLY